MLVWRDGTELVELVTLCESYGRYRLGSSAGERAMRHSLERYGQQTPIVVCVAGESLEVIDGFKRCGAARELGWSGLRARRIEAEERYRKAAIFGLNQTTGGMQELEEAWIIHALVREDGLSQLEVGEILGRHRSWVCRRLALVERLCPEAQEDLRLGLLRPTSARELVRLPAGNQRELVRVAQREQLTRDELRGVVDLLSGCSTQEQRRFVLERPREALAQVEGSSEPVRDPRLSSAGQRTLRRLSWLEERMTSLRAWLGGGGAGELTERDRMLLAPAFLRVADQAALVAESTRDLGSAS